MAGVHRSSLTEQYKQDMYDIFWDAYPLEPPVYESLFEVRPSDAAYEMFTTAIGLGELLEKPEGQALQSDSPLEGYTIVLRNRMFGRKIPLSYEAVKDAKKTTNLLQTLVAGWSVNLPMTKDKFYAKFFNYGAYSAGHDVFNGTISGLVSDPSGAKIYDSQPFFYTAHADKIGSTYSNFNSSRTLSADNLKTTYLTYTVTNNRNERGEVITMTPDTLLIHPALKFTAREILNTSLIPNSMDNTINVLSAIVNPVEWAQISGTDDWFLGKAKAGLLATNREDPIIDFWMDEETKDFYASIFCRFGGTITDWRFWIANNLPTS